MNKTLNVFVVDANGNPLSGAKVVASDGGVRIGSGTTRGQNRPVCLQLDDKYESIDISAEYGRFVKGPICVDLTNRNFEIAFEEVTVPKVAPWEKIAAFAFGVIFVSVLLGIAFLTPSPSDFQILVVRVVLALAAAGVAAIIPGFINIESTTTLYAIRAGGALGVFLLIFLVNPPALIHNNNERPHIPGDAAWLIGGRLRLDKATGQHITKDGKVLWATGPNFEIVATSDHESREIPVSGDQIKLLKERLLYIVDFKTSGVTKSNVEPIYKGTLDDSDETGQWLPAGTILEVRKVSEGAYPGEDNSFFWLRVGYPTR